MNASIFLFYLLVTFKKTIVHILVYLGCFQEAGLTFDGIKKELFLKPAVES